RGEGSRRGRSDPGNGEGDQEDADRASRPHQEPADGVAAGEALGDPGRRRQVITPLPAEGLFAWRDKILRSPWLLPPGLASGPTRSCLLWAPEAWVRSTGRVTRSSTARSRSRSCLIA